MSALVSELAAIEDFDPEIARAVSDLALDRWGDVMVRLESGVTLYYRSPLTRRRLQEGAVVLSDVRERHPDRVPAIVDLRFSDQVVVQLSSGTRR